MEKTVTTPGGIVTKEVYTDPVETSGLGLPGEYPFTRGPYPSMYRRRHWTMRQYAGFGTAETSNQRFHALLEAGQTGLSVAFDLPTQMGLDSDHPLARGEVGRVGVAIDTLDDMKRLLQGIPLGEVSTSMTINSTAPILLLFYELVAEAQGVPPQSLRGTVQNDMLKEYIARGTYIYPPGSSMRLVTDLIAYASQRLPRWNPISVSGYHIREAGATAAEELAFTIANGVAYVRAAMDAGLAVDDFAPRVSFFWNSHSHLFEEVAKFRAARRIWARMMREKFGARSPASHRMRFHAQTAGSSLTALQPENNIVRTTVQALAAVLGGTQSLHTNGFDEALSLPTRHSATLALRTQQILAFESGTTDTVDPLAGSFYVEALTDALEDEAAVLLDRIEGMGGAVKAVEWMQSRIEESAYRIARGIEDGSITVVGVNSFTDEDAPDPSISRADPQLEMSQRERLASHRDNRDAGAVEGSLRTLSEEARGSGNLLHPMRSALAAGATLGEVSGILRDAFGSHRPL
ncbi:MAG: methylmalonyl-CoA mutase family protein [bacterium]|nr:methylmalonyl-CoA mutase [Acidimicrobiia bacterium]MCY4649488.1 methylmalonyl-CoA mutase family protein [bacterium]